MTERESGHEKVARIIAQALATADGEDEPTWWHKEASSAAADAILADPAYGRAELDALKHDIERHIAIASELATENERLREALADIMDGVEDERLTLAKLRTSMAAANARAALARWKGEA